MVPMGACFEDFSYRETGDEKSQTLYKDPMAPRPRTSIPPVLALQFDVDLTLGSHGGHARSMTPRLTR